MTNTGGNRMLKWMKFGLGFKMILILGGIAYIALLAAAHAQGLPKSGLDSYNTPLVNESRIGTFRDDYDTPHINEGMIGTGRDDYDTPHINEGIIGTGRDDYDTPLVNEALIGTGRDDYDTTFIHEGIIKLKRGY